MVNSNRGPNWASLQDIRLGNVSDFDFDSDLDFDLSRSLKVKFETVIELSILFPISNTGPNLRLLYKI